MKKILLLVCVSALGGLLTLGGYKLFIEDEQTVIAEDASSQNAFFIPTNNSAKNLTYNAEKPDLISAANKTIDAVVHVKNKALVNGPTSLSDLFYGRQSQRAQVGTGSGVIISSDGHIITNNHVIAGASELSVTLNNNKVYAAKLIGTDEETDIALIKIEPDEELPHVTFGDSDSSQIGEWVLAVGNPFNLTSTVTAGIISAKSRDLSGGQSFIQTDAAVNPGNSGGALVNTEGQLIGINTAITSQTGSYIGYSFAVPSNIARKIVEDIMEFGDVQNGVLGVVGGALNSITAERFEVNTTEGFYVSEVQRNSGAEKAGIKSGDIIKRLDNVSISKFSDLSGYLKTKNPNDVVNVEVERNGDSKIIPVTLTKSEILSVEFMNMELRDLPSNFKKKYDIANGVIVQDTQNKWLYSKLGITKGYIITGINGESIESIDDIRSLKNKYGDDVLENLESLEYINSRLEKKEVFFR
ncbi:trypsin-like peptidase domain-containing protein [Winogradskyella sp. A3E31]|uniref:trypsin-like peptidase domain-containing protein n=1 Tax=Winogradskyella sp. A3E31 TaxID=3349637 RepID=UPI00398B4E52